ncbi:MAG: response regulator transcription factor [Desulfuromonadaceae bacterium]|nr:response regulator transcription factor [Desulfuromonadaceae bacterium]
MLFSVSKAKYFHTTMQNLTCKVLPSFDALFETLSPRSLDVVFLHLEDEPKTVYAHCKELLSFAPQLKIVVFRSNPNALEGCSLLKLGVKGYAHAMSHPEIMKHICQSVEHKNVWVYPELMQFMIEEVNAKQVPHLEKLSLLSAKEKEIALMVSDGLSNAAIATMLHVAEITVKKYLSTIYEKLGVKDRLALTLFIKHA